MIKPVKDITIRYVILLSILYVISSCEVSYQDHSEEFNLLTSKKAYEVDRHQLQNGIQQLNYSLDLPYPNRAVTESALNKLKKIGWGQCSTSGSGWDKFANTDNEDNPFCQYQNNIYLTKGDNLLLITMQYYSSIQGNYTCREIPDNIKQAVAVVIYPDVDIEKQIKRLKLSCD